MGRILVLCVYLISFVFVSKAVTKFEGLRLSAEELAELPAPPPAPTLQDSSVKKLLPFAEAVLEVQGEVSPHDVVLSAQFFFSMTSMYPDENDFSRIQMDAVGAVAKLVSEGRVVPYEVYEDLEDQYKGIYVLRKTQELGWYP